MPLPWESGDASKSLLAMALRPTAILVQSLHALLSLDAYQHG